MNYRHADLTDSEIKAATLEANKHGVGFKADSHKLNWGLIPWKELEEVVAVLQYGADKYSPDNWQKVTDAKKRYFAATMRHLVAWQLGEYRDFDSQYAHLAHAVCCLLFLMWFDNRPNCSGDLPVDNEGHDVLPCDPDVWELSNNDK